MANRQLTDQTGRADHSRRLWLGRMSAAMIGAVPLSALAAETAVTEQETRRYRLAFALGGGCIRAFAHLGVIKTLEASDIRPDLIVGTSAGAMVGALCAAGPGGERLEAAANSLTWDALQELRLSKFGVYSLEPMRALVNRQVGGKSIERFPTRFAAVATDLRTGAPTALDRGEPGLAVMASSSVPGLVRPTSIGGREFIDGGVACPVPVRVARALGAETVIGIDVSYRPEDTMLNNAVDVAMQAFSIASRHLGLEELGQADVVIAPQIGALTDMKLENNPALITAGAHAARAALPAIRAALARVATPKS